MIIRKGKMEDKFPKNMSPEFLKLVKDLEDMEEGDSLFVELPTEMETLKMAINVMGYLMVNEYSSYQIELKSKFPETGNIIRIDYLG